MRRMAGDSREKMYARFHRGLLEILEIVFGDLEAIFPGGAVANALAE